MALYIGVGEYDDIRAALGLDPESTTPISDTLIERRMFLGDVERQMTAILETCEITMDEDDVDYDADVADQIKTVIVNMTASYLASKYLAKRAGDRIKSETLGPATVTYDAATDWAGQATELYGDAVRVMTDICEDGGWALTHKPFAVSDWETDE